MTYTLFRDDHGGGNTAGRAADTNATNASAIRLDNLTTNLTVAASTNETRTLAAGVEGQVKVIRAGTVGASGTCAVTLTGNPAATDVLTFNAAEDWAVLLYTSGQWLVVATNSVTVA